MKENKTTLLVWTALFTALTTVATMIIRIPSPTGGYLNAGDALVILSACVLGPFWGAAAAGLGSALADLITGYVIYAPATFVIKALMALAAGLILRRSAGKHTLAYAVCGSVAAEIIMICGYFAFTALILDLGLGALAEIPGNCVQGAFGAIVGTALFMALRKIPNMRSNF